MLKELLSMEKVQTDPFIVIESKEEENETLPPPRTVLFLSEFSGTLFLILLTCMGCTLKSELTYIQLCFNAGLVVMAIIHILGPISGALVNPVVSLAYWMFGKCSVMDMLVYIVAQILGSIAGYGILMVLTPKLYYDENDHCMNLPSNLIDEWQGFGVEVVLTFVLMLANCATWDPKNKHISDSVSLRIGLTVVILNLVGNSYTGASMNPARSFGPAIWNNNWTSFWIYIFGPLIGGVLGTVFYKYILLKT
ncbi:aquaporin AQPcic isoform X2 [Aethina tumida]|uniref:aquaporin AQPcic isoform X2 n=1 Tax=Aethina tumida TaxID=116153 RepID=UPI0021474C99|nr:aquaporin AQPcic isoform X2 [Aethina tumida]